MRPLPAKRIVAALEDNGFVLTRQRGSHQIYTHPDGRMVPVPWHGGNRPLPTGTFHAIIRQSGLKPEDF
ncbi:MAG: type II toxin-antitoxin system HicA family toxin [Patescibacteria group bacterium]